MQVDAKTTQKGKIDRIARVAREWRTTLTNHQIFTIMSRDEFQEVFKQRRADYKRQNILLMRQLSKLKKEFHKGNVELMKVYQSAKKNFKRVARWNNAAFWMMVGVSIICLVCYYWKKQGCGWDSLTAAIIQYGAFTACFWALVDNRIKENNQNNQ